MKTSHFAAAALTTLLTGERFSESFANHWMVYSSLILGAIAFWIWFLRKPPVTGSNP